MIKPNDLTRALHAMEVANELCDQGKISAKVVTIFTQHREVMLMKFHNEFKPCKKNDPCKKCPISVDIQGNGSKCENGPGFLTGCGKKKLS